MGGGASDSMNLDVIMGFDERQLLVQLNHWNLINHKGFILYHHSPVNVNVLMYPRRDQCRRHRLRRYQLE